MAIKGDQWQLGATESSPRPGAFPVGSTQSRAAARAMLERWKANEELGFRVVSIADRKRVNLDGLAEQLSAAIKNHESGASSDSLPAIESGQDRRGERRADCLSERIRTARERVERTQALDSIR